MAARRSSVARLLLWLAVLAQGRESTASLQSLEVSLSTTSLGMPDLLGHGIDLTCSLNSSDVHPSNTLQWLDGEIPIESSSSREIIRCGNSITLRFHNFSTLDFGMYTCRCVNEDYEMEQFCSQPSSIIHLPEELPNITEVEIPSTLVLNCDNNGSTWTKINSTAVEVWEDQQNVSVTSPQDQGKFVCHDGSTVHQVVYVYIKGYQPIRIFYPDPNQAASVFNKGKPYIKMCSADIPTSSIRLYVIADTGMGLLYPYSPGLPNLAAAEYENSGIKVGAVPNISRVDLLLSFTKVDESIYSDLRQQLQGQSYMCTFSSKWENISVTFNLTLLPNASVPTESPQITSTVLPNMCTGILPLISSTSVSPSATPGVSSLQFGTAMVPPMRVSPSPTEVSSLQFGITMVPPMSHSPSPTTAPLTANQESAVIAGITVSVIIATVAMLMSVTVIVLWRKRCRNNRRGKITRKDKSSIRRLLIPRTKESLRASSMHNNFIIRPSLVPFQQKDPLHSLASVSLMYDGVPVSRQLAKCFCELEKSQWLFPYNELKFEGELGSGAFGVVRKAQALSMQPGNPSTTVAVKTLKDITSDEDEKDIISELKVLQHVGVHPNVVSLLGAAIHEGKLHIIVEFCCHGNLLHYLRSKRKDSQNPLCTRQLVKMAGQIARGMEHLSSKNCIHRDLAARNVLIGEGFVLKVADFGLARKMYHTIYRPSAGKIPIKWMAPETIIDQEYTSQSDVWSFGILLWEIMTLGQSPYPGKPAGSVLKDVKMGYRMPKPVDCPQSMYSVMSQCWHVDPSARPTFSHLGSIFEAMLKQEMPNHYYNILDETIVGDISDSTSHDSPCEAYCQCSYSKNNNTTSTSTCSVFCSQCGLNNSDYINKVVENGKLQKNTTRASVDSCDSGVHESVSDRPSISVSELTPTDSTDVDTKEDTEDRSGDYLKIIASNTEEQSHLPFKPSQSKSCLPTITAAESVQSLCSNCRVECGQQEVDMESQMKTGSVLSLCSTCKVQVGCETIAPTAAESITIDMDKVTHWNSHTDDNTNWSSDTRCTDVPNHSYYNTLGALLFCSKDPLAAQKSNDSGIVSVCSETWEGYVCNKSQPDQNLKVLPDCTKLATTNECSDQYPHSVDTTMITEITRNRLRLSAHPRYRSLFDQLGIQESDV